MGAVSGMLGLGGGAAGSGFAGPSSGGGAVNPFGPDAPKQVTNSYNNNQGALAEQQHLLAALQGQNGLANQSQVYNQQQGIVNGTGPNPAQAMLNQQTGTNVANQAALMAGQRGANANVGLLARQAAQQGANTQQQAVGQGATMQANQSLNALSNAGTIAGNQVSNQINATGANTTGFQNEQGQLLNALAGYNSTNAGLQANINNANASLANTTMQGTQALVGGGMNALGAASGMMKAQGGVIQNFGIGGTVQSSTSQAGPMSSLGQFLQNPTMPDYGGPLNFGENKGAEAMRSGMSNLGKKKEPIAQGSSGELPGSGLVTGDFAPSGTTTSAADNYSGMAAAQGGSVGDKLKAGGHVPGTPNVGGAVNSYANDNVKAVLSPGEIVLPRSVTQSADPISASAKFVQAVMAKRKRG